MIALIIIGALVLLIGFLLSCSLVFDVWAGDETRVQMRFLFWKLQLVPADEKKKARKTQKKSSQKKQGKKPAAKPESKAKKAEVKLGLQTFRDLLESASAPFRFFVKKIRLIHVKVKLVVSEEDAAQTAISYGRDWAYVHSALAFVSNFCSVQVDEIDISMDFLSEKPETMVSFALKSRGYVLLIVGLRFLVRYLRVNSRREEEKMQNFKSPSKGGRIPPSGGAGRNQENSSGPAARQKAGPEQDKKEKECLS